MKKDNRGFTLTELLVSIVILAIVALAAFSFMTAGAKSFTSVDTRISRQLTAQIALGQVSDRLMNCNKGICVTPDGSNSKLYILSSSGTALSLDAYGIASGNLNYGSTTPTAKSGVENTYTATVNLRDRVAAKVESFTVTLPAEATAGTAVRSVTVSLKLKNDTRTYTQTVALRNAPLVVTVTS